MLVTAVSVFIDFVLLDVCYFMQCNSSFSSHSVKVFDPVVLVTERACIAGCNNFCANNAEKFALWGPGIMQPK